MPKHLHQESHSTTLHTAKKGNSFSYSFEKSPKRTLQDKNNSTQGILISQMMNSAVKAPESRELHSPALSNTILTCSVFAPSLQVKRSQRTQGSISRLGPVLKMRKKHNKDHNFVLAAPNFPPGSHALQCSHISTSGNASRTEPKKARRRRKMVNS